MVVNSEETHAEKVRVSKILTGTVLRFRGTIWGENVFWLFNYYIFKKAKITYAQNRFEKVNTVYHITYLIEITYSTDFSRPQISTLIYDTRENTIFYRPTIYDYWTTESY